MIDTMRDAPGVGLAASQVGVPERVIVVEYAEPEESEDGEEPKEVEPRLYVMVNPEIVKASQETEIASRAACLSPGWSAEVERTYEIRIKGQNAAASR